MEVNYDQLILSSKVPINESLYIKIPTISELAFGEYNEFMIFTRVFVTSVREQFSGAPSEVDEIEEKFPSFLDMAFDDNMSKVAGQMMFGEGMDLLNVIVNGLAYWTKTDINDYKALSNHKIVNEKANWVIDREEYEQFCNYIRMITLSEPNEELIAPKNISKHPHQCQIWMNLYKGRIAKLQKKKSEGLGDKMLLLQAISPSYLSFEDMGNMTYYQFFNTLSAYSKMRANNREFEIYTSEKFDTKDMKLTDLSDEVILVKLKK